MSRFVPHRDMSASQLMDCVCQAQAIVNICRSAAEHLPPNEDAFRIGTDIDQALAVASELIGVMHDALASHEGLTGGAK